MAAWWPKQLKSDEEEKVGGVLFYTNLFITPFTTAGTPLSRCKALLHRFWFFLPKKVKSK